MDRRKFLSLLAVGAPAAVVAEKLGLIERLRSYFFAPRGGWVKTGELWTPDQQFELSMMRSQIATWELIRDRTASEIQRGRGLVWPARVVYPEDEDQYLRALANAI